MTKSTSKKPIKIFFSDEDNFVNLPFTIEYTSIEIERYEAKNMDIKYNGEHISDCTSIVGYLPIDKAHNNYYCTLKRNVKNISDTAFLASLLNLRLSLSEELFEPFQDINMLTKIDNNEYNHIAEVLFKRETMKLSINVIEPLKIKKSDINKIISWCKDYGYPYEVDNNSLPDSFEKYISSNKELVQKIKLRKTLIDPQKIINFWIWDFLRKLHILFLSFILFSKALNRDNELKALNIDDIWFSNHTVEQCQMILRDIYQNILLKSAPNFEFADDKYKSFQSPIIFSTSNAFDLAMYTLFFFMQSGKSYFKQCPICMQFFVPERKNQKYCHGIYDDEGNKKNNKDGKCYAQLAFKRKKKELNKS